MEPCFYSLIQHIQLEAPSLLAPSIILLDRLESQQAEFHHQD
ncbi:hypothetical protein SynSYN20_01046 [Synechococcus sp. SYN20]|nr:hypothetical protein SynSYN20_01046 [Synechococcus sp. SYN20]